MLAVFISHNCYAVRSDPAFQSSNCESAFRTLSAIRQSEQRQLLRKRSFKMAYTITTTYPPFGAIAVHNFVNRIMSLKDSFRAWNEMRVTRKALLNLSEAQLKDSGLNRFDLL